MITRPLGADAAHVTTTCELPAAPTTLDGAPGIVNGLYVVGVVAKFALPHPLIAATLNR